MRSVGILLDSKFYGMLGLAKRARKVVSGSEGVVSEIQGGNAYIVFVAKDTSERSKKTIFDKCRFYDVKAYTIENRDKLGKAIGLENCVAVAIVDKNFADGLERIYNNNTEVAENGSC